MWLCSPLRFCDKSNTCGGGFPFRRKAWWGRSPPHGPRGTVCSPRKWSFSVRAAVPVQASQCFPCCSRFWPQGGNCTLDHSVIQRRSVLTWALPWALDRSWTLGHTAVDVAQWGLFYNSTPIIHYSLHHIFTIFFFKLNTIFQLIGEDPSDLYRRNRIRRVSSFSIVRTVSDNISIFYCTYSLQF